MVSKKIFSVVLLGFVGVSLVLAVADVAGWRRQPKNMTVTEVPTTAPELTAVFFHATHRCPTCRKIEDYAHNALQSEIEHNTLAWQVMDYTARENSDLVKQLEVMTSTVVLIEKRQGKVVRWKNLEEVWDYTHDQAKFTAFMHDAWKSFQKAAT